METLYFIPLNSYTEEQKDRIKRCIDKNSLSVLKMYLEGFNEIKENRDKPVYSIEITRDLSTYNDHEKLLMEYYIDRDDLAGLFQTFKKENKSGMNFREKFFSGLVLTLCVGVVALKKMKFIL